MKYVTLENSNKGGHYSPGIISKGMLYISGQLPINHDTGKLVGGGLEDQVLQTLKNIELVLKSAGLTMDDVVLCRIYTPDINNWDRINEVYSKFFGEHKPARVVISTNELHLNAMVVIEAMAEVED